MRLLKELYLFSRAETIALVALLALLCVGLGIHVYQRLTEPIPAEVYIRSLEVEQRADSPVQIPEKPRAGKKRSTAIPVINVNTAPAESLMMLPGVGSVLAQRIIEFRDSLGRFDSVERLREVSGIGAVKLEQLRPFAKVR